MCCIEVTSDRILEATWSGIQMVTRETSFKHCTACWEQEILGTARITVFKVVNHTL